MDLGTHSNDVAWFKGLPVAQSLAPLHDKENRTFVERAITLCIRRQKGKSEETTGAH